MRRFLALTLAVLMCLGTLSACDFTPENPGEEPIYPTWAGGGKEMLDGKKILFVGNSQTYYGRTVIYTSNSDRRQEQRQNNQGYFYQLCKANGMNVEVTNWTFGNHSLQDLFNVCAAGRGCDGIEHVNYLTDRYFDYVIIQPGSRFGNTDSLLADFKLVSDVFKEANPDVKFVFHVQRRAHENNYEWLSGLKELEKKGVLIVDWGKLVNDLIVGNTTVPGGKETYNQNSFIIRKSKTDGSHPNMLTGYVTTLMLYCAITGESAVGQPSDFCGNTQLHEKFDMEDFLVNEYCYDNATTNMVDIFNSPEDIAGIQTLVDQYIAAKHFLNY